MYMKLCLTNNLELDGVGEDHKQHGINTKRCLTDNTQYHIHEAMPHRQPCGGLYRRSPTVTHSNICVKRCLITKREVDGVRDDPQ